MRFEKEGNSSDVVDRRGSGGTAGRAGLGIGGLVIVGVIALLMGKSPGEALRIVAGQAQQQSQNSRGRGQAQPSMGARNAQEREAEVLVRRATTDIQDFWSQALPQMARGQAYPRTQLVLFADEIRSACGNADAQTGPFYCPGDHLVYIDLAFYSELSQRFRAPGDFAQAYVLAHEFGHHVQSVLGIEARVRSGQRTNRAMANALSVAMELQADCFAGVWASSAARRGLLQPNDVEEGLTAAASIGDDHIQQMAGRRVSPERFTHGSSAQRTQWFRAGMSSANINACATFGQGAMAP
jgi:predicted metalloprotease